jgi:hypothetical protein
MKTVSLGSGLAAQLVVLKVGPTFAVAGVWLTISPANGTIATAMVRLLSEINRFARSMDVINQIPP